MNRTNEVVIKIECPFCTYLECLCNDLKADEYQAEKYKRQLEKQDQEDFEEKWK